jgi:hypothetical protein
MRAFFTFAIMRGEELGKPRPIGAGAVAGGENMREDDLSYFRRRALQEQVAAEQAVCEAARLRHDELATMYRFRATMLSSGRECWAHALAVQLAAQAA